MRQQTSTLPKNLALPEDRITLNSARKSNDDDFFEINAGDDSFENTVSGMLSKGNNINAEFKRKPLSALGILMQGEKAKLNEMRKLCVERKQGKSLSKLCNMMHNTDMIHPPGEDHKVCDPDLDRDD